MKKKMALAVLMSVVGTSCVGVVPAYAAEVNITEPISITEASYYVLGLDVDEMLGSGGGTLNFSGGSIYVKNEYAGTGDAYSYGVDLGNSNKLNFSRNNRIEVSTKAEKGANAYGIDASASEIDINGENSIIANAEGVDNSYAKGLALYTSTLKVEGNSRIEARVKAEADANAYGIYALASEIDINGENSIIANAEGVDNSYARGLELYTSTLKVEGNNKIEASAKSAKYARVDGIYAKNSQIDINGESSIIVNAEAVGEGVKDLYAYAINASEADTVVNITDNKIIAATVSGTSRSSSAIPVYVKEKARVNISGGKIIVIGEEKKGYALVASSEGIININKDNEKKDTQIIGDVGATSRGEVNINLNTADSFMEGTLDDSAGYSYAGTINLKLDNGASVNLLNASSVTKLTGADGSINVDDVNALHQKLRVGKNENTGLKVVASQKLTDTLTKGDVTSLGEYMAELNNVVNIGDGIEERKIISSEGIILGELNAEAVNNINSDEDGFVSGITQFEEKVNRPNEDLQRVASLGFASWRAEMNDMNKRLGELRASEGEQGAWARMTRSKNVYQGASTQGNAYQVGYDHKLDDTWTVGAAFIYSDNNLASSYMHGDSKDKAVAIYGSKLNDDGSFIDIIAKYAKLDYDYKMRGMTGAGDADFGANAWSLSAEYGKRFTNDKGAWVEPQVELTYGRIGSTDYTTSHGVKVEQDGMKSLVARLGLAVGQDLPGEKGNVYARASYLYDFDGEANASLHRDDITRSFKNDLGGGWWEVGVGANVNLSKATHAYVDVQKGFGGEVDNKWQWNVGVRYSF